nr:PREDICTED: uncharacterized protein LOC108213832 [Daucus carota subsp. sativus]
MSGSYSGENNDPNTIQISTGRTGKSGLGGNPRYITTSQRHLHNKDLSSNNQKSGQGYLTPLQRRLQGVYFLRLSQNVSTSKLINRKQTVFNDGRKFQLPAASKVLNPTDIVDYTSEKDLQMMLGTQTYFNGYRHQDLIRGIVTLQSYVRAENARNIANRTYRHLNSQYHEAG